MLENLLKSAILRSSVFKWPDVIRQPGSFYLMDWSPAYQITLVAVMLLFGVFSSRLSSRLNMPVLLLFLGAGMLIGSNSSLAFGINAEPAVAFANGIGTIAMAFILYSGGLETDMRGVRKIFVPGMILSTLGVFMTAAFLAIAVHFMLGWSWGWSFMLGAIVSSTDAAAVFSILRSKGVGLKGKLAPLLEFESGSNDPMAALLTLFMVSYLKNPADTPLWLFLIQFPLKMLIGIACGYLIGRLGCKLFNKVKLDYEGLYFVLGIAVVLLAYGLTECIYGNGFMAAYCAGLTMGNVRYNYKRSQVKFNNGLAWLMQVFMFTVLGMLVTVGDLISIPERGIFYSAWMRGLILAVVLMVIARPLAVFIGLAFSRFSKRERLLISWVGLRGAAPIVLATFPLAAHLQGNQNTGENATVLFNLVFCMVIMSVIIQGRTLMPLAKLLKLDLPFKDKKRMPLELEETGVMNSLMREFDVNENSPCLDKTLAQCQLPLGVRVMLIRRSQSFVMPKGDTKLQLHDGLLVMGDSKTMQILVDDYLPGNTFTEEL